MVMLINELNNFVFKSLDDGWAAVALPQTEPESSGPSSVAVVLVVLVGTAL